MKILWFTWKDMKHPLAGGAEVVADQLAKRLVQAGHEVTLLSGGFPRAEPTDTRNGYQIIRMPGGRVMVYVHAFNYYRKHLVGWADVVIEEINTIPFFTRFYVKEKSVLFFHQLAREIWFYQFFFPLNIVGYLAEPIYLWLIRNKTVVTISESTKRDLMRFGFKSDRIHIISEGIEMEPIPSLAVQKYDIPTMLSFGSIRPMKRTDQIISAFEIAKEKTPNLQLIIAGAPVGRYGEKVKGMIENSKYKSSITYYGKTTLEQKLELMQKSHVQIVTSLKEGWGLVVTEANSQGTPAVVYNVDGLRDSVQNGKTGIVCSKNSPQNLAENITSLLSSPEYETIRKNAWEWSKEITFDKSCAQLLEILEHA